MLLFFRRLWKFVRPYKTRLLLGLLCGILFALCNGFLVVGIKVVVNLVFTTGKPLSVSDELAKAPSFFRPLASYLESHLPELSRPSSDPGRLMAIAAIPVIMLLRGLFGYLNVYLMTWSAVRAIADMRAQLFDHLQNLSLSFFSKAKTGDLISRTTNDTYVLYGIIGNSLASLIKDPVTIIVLMTIMLLDQPRLTLVSMIVLPVCIVPIAIYGKKVRKSAKAMQGHISELTNLMHESFTGNRIIKAYNLESTVLEQFRVINRKYIGHILRVIRSNEIPSQLTEFLAALGVALVLIYVVEMKHGTPPNHGDFTMFILSIVVMYQPIKSLTKLHNQLHQASAASQRVFELLEETNPVIEPARPVTLKAAGADICFEEIHFDYGEKPVLRDVNFTVKSGQLLALVGKSGSGKTTLTNLLLRFYDPQRGAVLIGGTDIRSVSVKELRREVALVAQETILFNDTIRNNIALGRAGASEAEIIAAARNAYAHDFIMEKPEGYQTLIGEKGVALSGGQRQRIAIARALLRNAPILVLDEATSSLDTESERAVQAALERLMEGRTTICIAHRLSTIQKADVIIVMDSGQIVERGTHSDLLGRDGIYRKLCQLQIEAPLSS